MIGKIAERVCGIILFVFSSATSYALFDYYHEHHVDKAFYFAQFFAYVAVWAVVSSMQDKK